MPYLDYTNEPEPEFDAYTGAALPAPAPSFAAGNKGLIPALMDKYPSVQDAFTGKGLARAPQEKAHQNIIKRQQAALHEGSPTGNPYAGLSEAQIQSGADELLRRGRQKPSPPGNPWAGLSEAQIQSSTDQLLNRGRKESTPRQVLERRGFSPLEQDFDAGDGSRPADIYYKEDADAGTTRYEIPGTTGFAEFQGQRKGGGSFSVMPGLSAANKKRYAELKVRDQREAERREYRDFANEVLSQYGDYPAVAMEILKQAEASMQTRVSTEQAGLQAAREAQQAQRTAQEDRRRWEVEQGLSTAQAQLEARSKGQELALNWFKARQVDPEKTIGTLQRFMSEPNLQGERSFNFSGFNGAMGILPLPSSAAQIRPGVPYFDAKDQGYVVFDREGNPQPLGGPFELVRAVSQ